MIFEGVARVEHRRDPALRPRGRPAGELALREHEHAAMVGERDRGGEARGARADDDDVVRNIIGHQNSVRIERSRDAPRLCFVLMGVSTRSEEHTSELKSQMRISYAVFCLKKKK